MNFLSNTVLSYIELSDLNIKYVERRVEQEIDASNSNGSIISLEKYES